MSTCELNEYLEQALRDELVCGNGPTCNQLITETRLTLVKCSIEIAQSLEKNSQEINLESQQPGTKAQQAIRAVLQVWWYKPY